MCNFIYIQDSKVNSPHEISTSYAEIKQGILSIVVAVGVSLSMATRITAIEKKKNVRFILTRLHLFSEFNKKKRYEGTIYILQGEPRVQGLKTRE